ncbi:hypothetical protein BC936DRAFT_145068, partial [Jimgerdemannia flammicorona]
MAVDTTFLQARSIPSTDVSPVDPTPLQATSVRLPISFTDVSLVDSTHLQATSTLLPIPSTDVSPVVHDKMSIHSESPVISLPDTEVQDTEVASADDNSKSRQDTKVASTADNPQDTEESYLLSFKIDIPVLQKLNRFIKADALIHPSKQQHLNEVSNRLTKFQAAARGYLLRTKPWILEFKSRKLFASKDQETISREAMEGRFEEVVDDAFPQLVEHPPSGGKPAQPSKEINTPPLSKKRSVLGASVNDTSRSRSAAPDRPAAKPKATTVLGSGRPSPKASNGAKAPDRLLFVPIPEHSNSSAIYTFTLIGQSRKEQINFFYQL